MNFENLFLNNRITENLSFLKTPILFGTTNIILTTSKSLNYVKYLNIDENYYKLKTIHLIKNNYNFYNYNLGIYNAYMEERLKIRFFRVLLERSVDFISIQKFMQLYKSVSKKFFSSQTNKNKKIIRKTYLFYYVLFVKKFIFKFSNLNLENLNFFSRKKMFIYCFQRNLNKFFCKFSDFLSFYFSLIISRNFFDLAFVNTDNCFGNLTRNYYFWKLFYKNHIKFKNMFLNNFNNRRSFIFNFFVNKFNILFINKNYLIDFKNNKLFLPFNYNIKPIHLTYKNKYFNIVDFFQKFYYISDSVCQKKNVKLGNFYNKLKIFDFDNLFFSYFNFNLYEFFRKYNFYNFLNKNFFLNYNFNNNLYFNKFFNRKFSRNYVTKFKNNSFFKKKKKFNIYFNSNNKIGFFLNFNTFFLQPFYHYNLIDKNYDLFLLKDNYTFFYTELECPQIIEEVKLNFELKKTYEFLKKYKNSLLENLNKEKMNPKTYFKKFFFSQKYKDIFNLYLKRLALKKITEKNFNFTVKLKLLTFNYVRKVFDILCIYLFRLKILKFNRNFVNFNDFLKYFSNIFNKNNAFSLSLKNRLNLYEYNILINSFLAQIFNSKNFLFFKFLNSKRAFLRDSQIKKIHKKYLINFNLLKGFFKNKIFSYLFSNTTKQFVRFVFFNKYYNSNLKNYLYNYKNLLQSNLIENLKVESFKKIKFDYYFYLFMNEKIKFFNKTLFVDTHKFFFFRNFFWLKNYNLKFIIRNIIMKKNNFFPQKFTLLLYENIFNVFNNFLFRKVKKIIYNSNIYPIQNYITSNNLFIQKYSLNNFINNLNNFNFIIFEKFFKNNNFYENLKLSTNFFDIKKISHSVFSSKKLLFFFKIYKRLYFLFLTISKNKKYFLNNSFFMLKILSIKKNYYLKNIFCNLNYRKLCNFNNKMIIYKSRTFQFNSFFQYIWSHNLISKFLYLLKYSFVQYFLQLLSKLNFNTLYTKSNNYGLLSKKTLNTFIFPFFINFKAIKNKLNILWLNINVTKRNVYVNLFTNRKKPSVFVYTAGQTHYEGKLKKSKEASIIIGKKIWKKSVFFSRKFFNNSSSLKLLKFINFFKKFQKTKKFVNYLKYQSLIHKLQIIIGAYRKIFNNKLKFKNKLSKILSSYKIFHSLKKLKLFNHQKTSFKFSNKNFVSIKNLFLSFKVSPFKHLNYKKFYNSYFSETINFLTLKKQVIKKFEKKFIYKPKKQLRKKSYFLRIKKRRKHLFYNYIRFLKIRNFIRFINKKLILRRMKILLMFSGLKNKSISFLIINFFKRLILKKYNKVKKKFLTLLLYKRFILIHLNRYKNKKLKIIKFYLIFFLLRKKKIFNLVQKNQLLNVNLINSHSINYNFLNRNFLYTKNGVVFQKANFLLQLFRNYLSLSFLIKIKLFFLNSVLKTYFIFLHNKIVFFNLFKNNNLKFKKVIYNYYFYNGRFKQMINLLRLHKFNNRQAISKKLKLNFNKSINKLNFLVSVLAKKLKLWKNKKILKLFLRVYNFIDVNKVKKSFKNFDFIYLFILYLIKVLNYIKLHSIKKRNIFFFFKFIFVIINWIRKFNRLYKIITFIHTENDFKFFKKVLTKKFYNLVDFYKSTKKNLAQIKSFVDLKNVKFYMTPYLKKFRNIHSNKLLKKENYFKFCKYLSKKNTKFKILKLFSLIKKKLTKNKDFRRLLFRIKLTHILLKKKINKIKHTRFFFDSFKQFTIKQKSRLVTESNFLKITSNFNINDYKNFNKFNMLSKIAANKMYLKKLTSYNKKINVVKTLKFINFFFNKILFFSFIFYFYKFILLKRFQFFVFNTNYNINSLNLVRNKKFLLKNVKLTKFDLVVNNDIDKKPSKYFKNLLLTLKNSNFKNRLKKLLITKKYIQFFKLNLNNFHKITYKISVNLILLKSFLKRYYKQFFNFFIFKNKFFKEFIFIKTNYKLLKKRWNKKYYKKKNSFEDKFFVPKRGLLLIEIQKKNRVVRGIFKGFLAEARGRKLFKRLKPKYVKIKKFIFTRSRKPKGRRK